MADGVALEREGVEAIRRELDRAVCGGSAGDLVDVLGRVEGQLRAWRDVDDVGLRATVRELHELVHAAQLGAGDVVDVVGLLEELGAVVE